jgi:hypothetical protein
MKTRIRIIPLTLLAVSIALLAWLFAFGGINAIQASLAGKPATATAAAAMAPRSTLAFEAAAQREGEVFSYNDSKYGFSIDYFVGMDVALEPSESVYLEFVSGFTDTSGLVIDLSLSRAKTAHELRDDAVLVLKAVGASRITQEEQVADGGKREYFLEAEANDPLTGESMIYRNAYYSCRDPNGGDYFASLSAVMPVEMLPELKFTDYIIYSFKC